MMNNIYNIFKRTAAVTAVILGMTSCLEKFPGDAIPENQGMKTFADAEQTLTGIYNAYMSGALYSGYLTLLPDIQADLVHAVEGNTNTYGKFWQWDLHSIDTNIESVYGSLYVVIGRCNFFLDQVEDLRQTITDDDDITALDYYTGEVYCARANAYAELIKCYCEAYDPQTADRQLGVALDSTYFGAKPSERSSLKDSYAFVVRDIEKAIELLDEDYDGYTNPYFTDAAANALYARVALYMQDWDKAVEYSTKVIENKALALSTSSVYTSGTDPISGTARSYTYVDYMWTHDLATEIIWQVGFNVTSYGGALGQVFLNYNNNFVYFYPDYMPSNWVLELYDKNDSRRSAYFRTLTTGYSGNPSLTLLTKYFGNEGTFIPQLIYHVSQPKPFRLAEQYLIRAEAYCQKGNATLASKDIATLREARGTKGISMPSDRDAWLKIISEERVRELYMEGFRLHDLKRWNMGFKREAQSYAQKEGSTLEIKSDDYRFVWPIPKHDIEAPGSKLQQNRGY